MSLDMKKQPLEHWQDIASKVGALPAFREIKRRLKSANVGQKKNRILFTNLESGAGATLCALAFMQSVGLEQDTTALFVDANVFNPVFPADFCDGLMAYLDPKKTAHDELASKLSSIILHDKQIRDPDFFDDEGRLKWIPLGRISARSNELFASSRMSNLLKELSERYADRMIVIDGPSILKSAEGRTLLSHVDQIVVVVNEGVTLLSDLESFKKLIPSTVVVHYLLNNSLDPTLSGQYQTLSIA